MIKEMLAAGIIERAYGSPTGAPVMLVPKKKTNPNDPNEPIKYRLVIDYRKKAWERLCSGRGSARPLNQ